MERKRGTFSCEEKDAVSLFFGLYQCISAGGGLQQLVSSGPSARCAFVSPASPGSPPWAWERRLNVSLLWKENRAGVSARRTRPPTSTSCTGGAVSGSGSQSGSEKTDRFLWSIKSKKKTGKLKNSQVFLHRIRQGKQSSRQIRRFKYGSRTWKVKDVIQIIKKKGGYSERDHRGWLSFLRYKKHKGMKTTVIWIWKQAKMVMMKKEHQCQTCRQDRAWDFH